jgi:hypothetical protein
MAPSARDVAGRYPKDDQDRQTRGHRNQYHHDGRRPKETSVSSDLSTSRQPRMMDLARGMFRSGIAIVRVPKLPRPLMAIGFVARYGARLVIASKMATRLESSACLVLSS